MAAIPTTLAETGRRSSSSSSRRAGTYGRGGAGNMGPAVADIQPGQLETPTIKTEVYTTGRGGSGNMAKNTDPIAARKAQDVTSHPRRESTSDVHVGRGGGGNVFKLSQEEIAAAKRDNTKWESAVADERQGEKPVGLAEKGKEWLFGKGKA